MRAHRYPGVRFCTAAAIGAALLALAACGGRHDADAGAGAGSSAPLTQSNITLPLSVQVVSAK